MLIQRVLLSINFVKNVSRSRLSFRASRHTHKKMIQTRASWTASRSRRPSIAMRQPQNTRVNQRRPRMRVYRWRILTYYPPKRRPTVKSHKVGEAQGLGQMEKAHNPFKPELLWRNTSRHWIDQISSNILSLSSEELNLCVSVLNHFPTMKLCRLF